jgi:hypothetical protein
MVLSDVSFFFSKSAARLLYVHASFVLLCVCGPAWACFLVFLVL